MLTTPKLKVIAACLNGLSKAGYDVEESTDHVTSVKRLAPLGKILTPIMSPAHNDFSQGNCFWTLLMQKGEVVGGIAARLDTLGTESLGSFWRRQSKRVYGAGETDQLVYVSDFIDNEVRGDVVYFGDLVLGKEHRGRGDHLRYFTMYCQMLAAVMWDADWQYSFIPEVHAQAGMAYNYAFAKTIPGAQEWKEEPGTRKSSEVCVITSRTDLLDIASYFSRRPEKLRVVKN